ncbi:MAG TPA: Lrp/AsnC family transcriptional regulator [Steroidobacteraceae bacterium]|jgi:Lrp/AsnC family transcriptional regulator
MTDLEIDATDLKILRVLQQNAECSMQELARKVGLSHTPCWRRYNRLKEIGVILGEAAMIDPKKVGVSVNAICDIVLQHHNEAALVAFEKAVQTYPEIVACFAMTGPKDYLLRVMVASLEDYERFFKQKLLHLPGVATVNTSFAFNTVKWTTALPV